LGFTNKNAQACLLYISFSPFYLVAQSLTHPTFPFSQELMKAVMSKDSETMQKYMQDAEILQLMARFQKLSSEAGIDPSMFPPPPGME